MNATLKATDIPESGYYWCLQDDADPFIVYAYEDEDGEYRCEEFGTSEVYKAEGEFIGPLKHPEWFK